jgi:hypothetical protein
MDDGKAAELGAVVLITRDASADSPGASVTVPGDKKAVIPAGAPDTAKVTPPEKVELASAVKVMVPVWPRVRLRVVGTALTETDGEGGGTVTGIAIVAVEFALKLLSPL